MPPTPSPRTLALPGPPGGGGRERPMQWRPAWRFFLIRPVSSRLRLDWNFPGFGPKIIPKILLPFPPFPFQPSSQRIYPPPRASLPFFPSPPKTFLPWSASTSNGSNPVQQSSIRSLPYPTFRSPYSHHVLTVSSQFHAFLSPSPSPPTSPLSFLLTLSFTVVPVRSDPLSDT